MENPRKYGTAPYGVAVLHGGPGAPGEMAPVARVLSRSRGVLEPLQTAASIDGQVNELRTILNGHGSLPVILIGHSWGAWLGWIFAARHPDMVRKLILVGSGPFEEKYTAAMNKTRLDRLTPEERTEAEALMESLENPAVIKDTAMIQRFGELMSKSASFRPIAAKSELIDFQPDVFTGVMEEALALRKSGALLELGRAISCPVVALHGDYDPHPHRGVSEPLSRIVGNFRFVLLKNCGHDPWNETLARDSFFSILGNELN